MNKQHHHTVLDLYGVSKEALTHVKFGQGALESAARAAHLNPVDWYEHVYPNQAYSCGVLLAESHASIHTWPEYGHCAIDLFLCNNSGEKAERVLIEAFAPGRIERIVLSRGSGEPLHIAGWKTSHHTADYYEAYCSDKCVVRQRSAFQDIEIFDSKGWGRMLSLDGDIQVATADEHIYHELLVHPALLIHDEPRKILIIGGGDGGCIREVLKHKQPQSVVLVDIDEAVIRLSKKYMPTVSNGGFDDQRVQLIFEDAAHFKSDERFDVVIVDLTAPHGVSIPAYQRLAKNILSLLSDGGVLSMHSGWWSSNNLQDYSYALLESLPNIVLTNQWIGSFNCFWSFVTAWRNGRDISTVIKSLAASKMVAPTRFFNGPRYAKTAFFKNDGMLG